VKIPVHNTARLADVQQVHRDLAARKTTGATVMIP
jgi:NADPH2:quinone reductase